MAVKFSQFDGTVSPSKTSTTQYIVGFEGNTNIKWTMKALADEIGGGDNIYTADGTISSDRTVTMPSSGGLHFQVVNTAASKLSVGYEAGYTNITLNPARPIIGSAHRIQAGGVAMLSKYTAGNTLWFGNESTTNNSYGFNMGAAPNGTSTTVVTIKGQGTTSSTNALRVQDSGGTDLLSIADDGNVKLGKYSSGVWPFASDGADTQVTFAKTGTFKFNNSVGGNYIEIAGSGNGFNMAFKSGGFKYLNYSSNGGQMGIGGGGTTTTHIVPSAQLAIISNSRGFLPPAMTNTERDAISSPADGLMVYSETDNNLQFYNGSAWTNAGGSGGNIYTIDGTLGGARTVSMDGNNLTFSSSSGYPIIDAGKFSIYPNGNTTLTSTRAAFLSGNIDFNYLGHNANAIGLNFTSYGTAIRGYGFGLYGGGAWSTNGGYSVIGPDFTYTSGNALNARLGVIGKSSTSTTDYAFRVQDSAAADMVTVRDDGAIALGKGAVIQSTSNPQNNVVIGTGAKDRSSAGNASESIAIGRLAVGNSGSVSVGAQAKCSGTTSTSIGSQSEAKNNGVSLGHQAGGPNAGASAVSLGRFAQAKATGSIAIGTNTGLTGANSIVLNATTGVTSTTAAKTFGVYMSNNTTPDFLIAHDGNSYITGTGNFGFGDANTSPTATVDIDGTFRLRSATNVNGKVLTADANGNATWQTASSGGGYSPTISVENTNGGDVDLYDDGIVRLWLDDSTGDDIELEITNYASSTASTYHVNYTNYEGGASSARTTTVDLNQSGATSISTLDFDFTDDECMKLRIWSPRLGLGAGGESSGFPFYEITIVKSGTLYTGSPVITSVLKSTS